MTTRKRPVSARAARTPGRKTRSPRRTSRAPHTRQKPDSTPRTRSNRIQKAAYIEIVREITANHAFERITLPAIATPDGKLHFYLNAALPRDPDTHQPLAPLAEGICSVCGHAYAELIRKAAKNPRNSPGSPGNPEKTASTAVCDECRGDAWFERVEALESEIEIRLDTGTAHGRDLRFEREKYDFKSSQTRQIKHLAEEHSSDHTQPTRKPAAHDNE